MGKNLFDIIIFNDSALDPENDNVDVEVKLSDGTRYGATFYTPKNITTLLERYKNSGECRNGLYIWSSGMIIIRLLTPETIRETINDMLDSGEFSDAFKKLVNR